MTEASTTAAAAGGDTSTQTTSQTQQTQQQTQTQQTQQTEQTQAPQRPDYIPESYWDATKNAVKAEDLTKLFADHEARTKAAITDFSKYELKTSVRDLSDNELTIDRESPLVKALGEIATKRGWGNDDVQPLIDAMATAQRAESERELKDFLKFGGGDLKKANERAEAVKTKMATLLGYTGQPGADGKVNNAGIEAALTVLSEVSSAGAMEILEKLINAAGAPGAAAGGGGGVVEKDIAKRWYGNDKMKKAS